jgi:hypothetical protein
MWSFIIEATEGGGRAPPDQAQRSSSGDGGASAQRRGSRALAVVLTTHSMEECEALCSRVGIMHQVRTLASWLPIMILQVVQV